MDNFTQPGDIVRDNSQARKFQAIALFIVCLGVLVRLREFFAVRSLWVDESMLALNIINRSYLDLFSPLEYNQAAPILFLWIAKSFTLIGDTSELFLRLFPLISSLITLILFPVIARKYVSWRATIIALLFFAFSNPLIYYASEVKQYASDVLATCVSLLILLFILEKTLTNTQTIIALIIGCLLLTLSHPSVFVLTSNALLFLFVYYRTRTRVELLRVFIIATGWGITFIALYLISLANIAKNPELLTFWDTSFPPSLTEPFAFVYWFAYQILLFFKYPGGFGLELLILALPVCLLGIMSLFKRAQLLATSLVLPILLVFTAAALHKYPVSNRLLLFLTPFLYLFIGEGIDRLFKIKNRTLGIIIGSITLLLLLLQPISQAANNFLTPHMGEDIKPMIEYVVARWQNNDHLYIYYASAPPFTYYQDRFNFDEGDLTWGKKSRDDWSQYLIPFETTLQNNGRLWLLFSHVHTVGSENEEGFILENLSPSTYRILDEAHAENASVYLLQISR